MMDPRVRDLAFGAALYGIGQSGGMTGNIGADLRRIGTLPPPAPPTPLAPQAAQTAPVASMFGQDIYADGPSVTDVSGTTGAPGGFANFQTGIVDSQGVPLTVADVLGMMAQGLSFAMSPVTTTASMLMGRPTVGQQVKGFLTPVETASPVGSMAQAAANFASANNISFDDALAILSGGSYGEMGQPADSSGPAVSADTTGVGVGIDGTTVG